MALEKLSTLTMAVNLKASGKTEKDYIG